MAGISVSPSRTKDRSCKRPCHVAGVERMVGSVVKANPASASPARDKARDEITVTREFGKLRRSPEAKIIIMRPLKTNVTVMTHPKSPNSNPLGQSNVGAFRGCHPRESKKSYLRMVSVTSTKANNMGPTNPLRAASFLKLVP